MSGNSKSLQGKKQTSAAANPIGRTEACCGVLAGASVGASQGWTGSSNSDVVARLNAVTA
jgi:hypothetical protein